jgi:hypothetical protein
LGEFSPPWQEGIFGKEGRCPVYTAQRLALLDKTLVDFRAYQGPQYLVFFLRISRLYLTGRG